MLACSSLSVHSGVVVEVANQKRKFETFWYRRKIQKKEKKDDNNGGSSELIYITVPLQFFLGPTLLSILLPASGIPFNLPLFYFFKHLNFNFLTRAKFLEFQKDLPAIYIIAGFCIILVLS